MRCDLQLGPCPTPLNSAGSVTYCDKHPHVLPRRYLVWGTQSKPWFDPTWLTVGAVVLLEQDRNQMRPEGGPKLKLHLGESDEMKQDLGCCGLDETQRMWEETFTMRNFHYHLVAVDFLKSLCSSRRKPASMLKYLQLYLNQCLVDTTASNWAFSNHAFHLLHNALCLCDVIFSL